MPSHQHHHPRLAFTPEHFAALGTKLDTFAERTLARGRTYFQRARVIDVSYDPPTILAVVVGNRRYDTMWRWDADRKNWGNFCSCPVGYQCKHAVALAVSVLQDQRLPWRDSAESNRSVPVPASRTKFTSALADLRAGTNNWNRHRPLQTLLSHCPARLTAYDASLQGLLEEEDPDILCWQLAAEIARRSDGWLPVELDPFRQRPDLAQRFGARARQELARELVDWARRQRQLPERSVRFVLGLRGSGGQVDISLQVRLTTPRIDDEPRRMEQLRQLRSQAQHTPGLLPVDHLFLLDTLLEAVDRGAGRYSDSINRVDVDVVRRLLERAADSDRVCWSTDLPRELSEQAGIQGGQPVRLSPQAVRVLPACTVGRDGARVELHCFFPGGESTPIDKVVYVESHSLTSRVSSLVIANDQCWIVGEQPPDDILEKFRQAGGLDVPAEQCGDVLGMLAPRFDHVRAVLHSRTRFHAVRPLITLDMREDDWLQLRAFACTQDRDWRPGTPLPPGALVFEYTPAERWRPYAAEDADSASAEKLAHVVEESRALPGQSPAVSGVASDVADTDVWMEAPEPETTQPVLNWLGETGAEPGEKGRPGGTSPVAPDRRIGWWLKASPARMQALGELWDRRPPGVTYLGNDRLRRALSPAHRVFPTVKVKSSGVDFFQVSAEWRTEGMLLTDADMQRLRSASTRFVKLSSGWTQRDTIDAHDEAAAVLADLGVEVGGGEQTVSLWQLAHAKPESLAAFERMGADAGALEAIQRLRDRTAAFKGLPAVRLPRTVKADLRPYQKLGLDFLAHASALGIGAILADDMGLGKTVQALAWLEHLRKQDPGGGPALVVCPTSVMHNWLRETERFTPKMRVLLIRSGHERHGLWQHLQDYDLLVTNYALLRRDIERWAAVDLRAAILDEAQNIKNPDADVTRAAVQLNAKHRLALTGTPLENRALDLWSIVEFVNPGYLGNRSRFAARYDRLDAPSYTRALLAAKLRPILLRRMKQEVAPELPERIEERIDCELTAGQRKLYLAELQRSRRLVEELEAQPDGIRRNRIVILAALTRLRQICCHPALAKGRASLGSGKFDALFELLEPLLAEGHKVLVFSQFVECLKLLQTEMQQRTIKHHLLTGQTKKREEIVREFQEGADPSVFLISLKAGGTGLNLTAASYVVVFDPWWNPAVEAQAIDRTHRIGQKRTVIAYRLLALGTIEEKIWELQQKKAALVRDVLGEDGFGRSLTREDLSYLLAGC